MTPYEAFITGIPKAELHLHLEGSLEPEQMFDFARRNALQLPFASVAEIRQAYEFSNLQEFLDIYYQGMAVLQTEQDFHDLTLAYCRRVHQDNCRHVEVFFDPQGHTDRGIPFKIVIEGISAGLSAAKAEFGMSAKLIMCFLRHLSEEAAFETLTEAEPFLDRIAGVGLDSSETGHPPSKFARVFAQAKARGLLCVAHAGEEGPPDYIWQALEQLQVDRLDHGNRCLEDEKLVSRLAGSAMALTLCPLSNLKLRVVQDMAEHPTKQMLDAGLLATLNSDDPAYFGGYLNDNYLALAQALDLSTEDIITLAKNSFIGSFLSLDEKATHLAAIDEYVAAASN